MKLTRLEIQNFMAITAFEADFDGAPVVVVQAKNGAGKTAFLRAIQALFAGGKAIPDVPIKRGAKKAQIIGETETLVCKRTFSKGGTKLEVRPNKKGAIKLTAPQKVLDELIGMFLDPLEFDRMARDKRLQVLRDLVGLDFTEMDQQRKTYEIERRDAGRDLKKARARLEAIPAPSNDDPVESVSDLLAEIDRRQQVNDDHNSRRAKLDEMRGRASALAGGDDGPGIVDELHAEVKRLIDAAAEARHRCNDAAAELEKLRAEGTGLATAVGALVDEDVDEARARLSEAESIAAAAAKQGEREMLADEAAQLEAAYEGLTAKMEQVDQVKADALSDAKYPIEGLEACEDGVYLAGVPWEQGSSRDRIMASAAIGFALHPELKIVCVENASLLDAESLAAMRRLAAEKDGQAFLEIVGGGDEVAVVFESGEVSE